MDPLIPSVVVDPSSSPATADGEGDRAHRFRALFDAEFSYVWTSLRRMGVPARDLEDLTHDVLLEVYKRLESYDPSRPLRPWRAEQRRLNRMRDRARASGRCRSS